MYLEQRSSGWWIVGEPLDLDCGPYDRKADATSDMQGMARFFRHEGKPGFVTCDDFLKRRMAAHRQRRKVSK